MRVGACSSRSLLWLSAAPAQAQQVRLAAPSDCLTNTGCGVGLKSVYGLDVTPAFVPLTIADAGVSALDDGDGRGRRRVLLEPAALAPGHRHAPRRPRDDLPDRVVPVVRSRLLRAYGTAAADIRRRLNAASAALTTLALRGLNQSVIDGRLPGGRRRRVRRRQRAWAAAGVTAPGQRIVVGYMDFAENETLALPVRRGAAGGRLSA